MNAIMIVAGAVIAIMGRHSIAGLIIGAGLMLAGWAMIERKEGRG